MKSAADEFICSVEPLVNSNKEISQVHISPLLYCNAFTAVTFNGTTSNVWVNKDLPKLTSFVRFVTKLFCFNLCVSIYHFTMESLNLGRMITNKNLQPSSLDTSSAIKPNFLNVNKAKKNIPYKNQSVLCSQIWPLSSR